jgi:pimeloyl-ACP methyl ester carboxylesterase
MPFLELDNSRVHYAVRGDDGPWITVLHGGLVDMASMADLASRLADDARVLMLDLRGYGRTTAKNDDVSLMASAEDVVGVLDHLGADSTAVVGFSVGGMIAQLVALAIGDRVTGLVLMSTGCRVTPAQAEAFHRRARLIEDDGLAAERVEHVRRAFSPQWVTRNPDDFAAYADRVLDNDPHVVAATMRSIAEFDVAERLADVTAPALLLAGELDGGFGPEAADQAASHLQHATVRVIPGAGHTLHLEQPQAVSAHIQDFVEAASQLPRDPTDRQNPSHV